MAATFYSLFPVACAYPGFWARGTPCLAPITLAGNAAGTSASPAKPFPAKNRLELLALKWCIWVALGSRNRWLFPAKEWQLCFNCVINYRRFGGGGGWGEENIWVSGLSSNMGDSLIEQTFPCKIKPRWNMQGNRRILKTNLQENKN